MGVPWSHSDPTLFSAAALVGASFPIQSKSHPLSLSGGYRDVLHTEVLGMAQVHGLDQYGGWAGSSAVQCLSIFAGPWVQSLAPPPDKHIIGNHGCSCKGEFNRI